jgi:hypothetical protein
MMLGFRPRLVLGLAGWLAGAAALPAAPDWASLGPLYQEFRLTLAPGHRTEILGPLFYSQELETTHTWAASPLLSYTQDKATDSSEFDLVYPIITYDRFGPEYRFSIFQLIAFSGGQTQSETNVSRITIFPLYFQQRSRLPDQNYTAFIPFYGHLKHRLFRDEVKFILLPLYVESRKGDVVTDNYLYPIFHLRHGHGLKGWQVWPLVGHELKGITYRTNMWDEAEPIPGHASRFVLWPFYLEETTGIGSTNMAHQQALIPFYSKIRSPLRDSTSYLWPLGLTITDDREKKYHEVDLPWPLIVFAHGEGKTTRRVWPFFSQAHSPTLESDFYAWPIYRYSRIRSDPLDRQRTRILFFLFSDVADKNTETGARAHRVDFWPLFTARRDFDGNRRWQVLALLEPFVPGSKSIERDYSPVWSLWRAERNAQTGAASQSLLWNLYRHESAPQAKKVSLLFGLFQYQSSPDGRRWRLFYIPMGRRSVERESGRAWSVERENAAHAPTLPRSDAPRSAAPRP